MKSLGAKLLIFVCIFAVGALSALGGMKAMPNIFSSGIDSETRSTQLVKSITREEQVVLLSLGIQGIEKKSESGKFFAGTFFETGNPGGERTKFIQYTFKAKLGIEGKDVTVEQTGEGEIIVSIPEFIFIGNSDPDFELVAEKNGALSWATAEIDSLDMVNSILSTDNQKHFVDENVEILEDQARAFYRGIITSIDPTVDVTFEFHQ